MIAASIFFLAVCYMIVQDDPKNEFVLVIYFLVMCTAFVLFVLCAIGVIKT